MERPVVIWGGEVVQENPTLPEAPETPSDGPVEAEWVPSPADAAIHAVAALEPLLRAVADNRTDREVQSIYLGRLDKGLRVLDSEQLRHLAIAAFRAAWTESSTEGKRELLEEIQK